jgi:hypothetical protein
MSKAKRTAKIEEKLYFPMGKLLKMRDSSLGATS